MSNDLLACVLRRASDPETIHDQTKYWTAVGKIHARATREQVVGTEAAIGFELPGLLREILMEIGNGGFGPGYGLIGVEGGYADFRGDHLAGLARQLGALERKVLPICNWGCGIYSCLECATPDAPVSIFNPRTSALAAENIISVSVEPERGVIVSVYEREKRPRRPAIKTPKVLQLIPHKTSFREFISDWADGISLWDQIEALISEEWRA